MKRFLMRQNMLILQCLCSISFNTGIIILIIIYILLIILTWNRSCVLSNLFGNSTLTITDAKRDVPVVTLSTENIVKLTKLLTEGFKRPVYWNKYKIIPNKTYEENDDIR